MTFIAGFTGLIYQPTNDLFVSLIPIQVVFTSLVLFTMHRKWNKPFIKWATGVFIFGILIEVIGVHFGLFGQYKYGNTLGVKVFEVPVIMGLCWMLLIYITGSVSHAFWKIPIEVKALIAALLMTLLDFVLEPFAVKYGLWEWFSPDVPVQNYISWFVISYILLITFYLSGFRKSNRLALPVYIILLLFFSTMNLIV